MEPKEVQFITKPTTKPPDDGKSYVPVLVGGEEKWFLLSSDKADGITARDFDFAKGKRWAAEQKKAEAE